MPTLPWKKKHKGTRISRIVADLQSPPKRGGSLVVETGFPTSLIDLFVKNRDRLKKKNSKINKSAKNGNQIRPASPPSPLLPVPESSVGSGSPVFDGDDSPIPASEIKEEVMPEIVEVVPERDEVTESLCEDLGDHGRAVYRVLLKGFVVVAVVLAMSTKGLALAITISAFVLILADSLCKRFVRFLKPCGTAKVSLESLIQRVLQVSWIRKGLLLFKNMAPCKQGVVAEEEATVDQLIAESEIQIAEPLFVTNEDQYVGEIVSIGPQLELLSRDRRWGFLYKHKEVKELKEDMDEGQVLAAGNLRSRSAKVKAKIIKKLLPKKLRNSKKDKKKREMKDRESSSEVSSGLGDDVFDIIEEQYEPENGKEQERESNHSSSMLSLLPEEQCQEQVLDKESPVLNELSPTKMGGKEKEWNWGYLSLLVIVLAGLAGGRVVALAVTVSWCFTLKLIGTWRRSVNQPVIRCPVSVST